MKNTLGKKEKSIKYLYGSLSDTERDEFEELLFTDENAGLFVEDVENDLIDEYVRGELEFEQKREFEKKYLTSESRYERVALARTLQSELFEGQKETVILTKEKTGIWQRLAGLLKMPNLALAGGLATILLLALLGGIWLTSQPNGNENIAIGGNDDNSENITPVKNDSPKEVLPTPEETPLEKSNTEEDKPLENENNTDANKKANVEIERPKLNKVEKRPTPKPIKKKPINKKKPKVVERIPTTFVASLLPPLRNNQTPLLKIPAGAKTVRLQLFDNFGQKYEKFVIELNAGNGSSVWGQEINASKKGSQKSITINVPNNKFESGNYEIAVSGVTKDGNVEEINFYNFVVKKEKGKKQ